MWHVCMAKQNIEVLSEYADRYAVTIIVVVYLFGVGSDLFGAGSGPSYHFSVAVSQVSLRLYVARLAYLVHSLDSHARTLCIDG